MSATGLNATLFTPLVARGVRAYLAPVNRLTSSPTLFDPALQLNWNCEEPPAPWLNVGWIDAFQRTSESTILSADAGMPSTVRLQGRQKLAAKVSFRLSRWDKLSMALASASQQWNVLEASVDGTPISATPLLSNSTAVNIMVDTAKIGKFSVGDLVVVDDDYTSQIGFVGAGSSGEYIQSTAQPSSDVNYVRRVSFNVQTIAAIAATGSLSLQGPLIGGAPTNTMKIQKVFGFADREGGAFFQEWSALFVIEGVQGDKLFFYYPRLQPCQGAGESNLALDEGLTIVQPQVQCRALPIVDAVDGAQVLCYRTYLPSRMG